MNFFWILSVLVALFAAAKGIALNGCPAGFESTGTVCTAERPIHGECPPLSRYDVGSNRCIFVARG